MVAAKEPPMHFDNHELHGNLMKGFQNGASDSKDAFFSSPLHRVCVRPVLAAGNLRFEMILEPNGGIMFRCWNDDNSTNSEVSCPDLCSAESKPCVFGILRSR